MGNAKKIRYTLEMPDKVLVEFVTANDFDTLQSKHTALLEQVEKLVEKIKIFDKCLFEDENIECPHVFDCNLEIRNALASFEAWKKENLSE